MRNALVRSVLVLAFPAVLIAQSPDSLPRDTVTRVPPPGSFRITGAHLDSLPIDDPASAFAQIPGVFLRGGDVGLLSSFSLSIRGGPGNGAAVFIDGAPVRSALTGAALFTPALNGISAVDMITGVPRLELEDGQGGAISYLTPGGGDRLRFRATAHTDAPFGSVASVGYNRFAGDLSGPVARIRGLTFFASGTVQGEGSEYLGTGAQDVPTYVTGGLDTTVLVPSGSGSGTESIQVPKYVQWSGSCASGCQGLSRPMDWRTSIQLQGKLEWRYGEGSRVSVTGMAAGFQVRTFPGTSLGDPSLFSGSHEWSRFAVVNWHHQLTRALAAEVVMSLATDNLLSGALAPASELGTRDPSLGMEFSALTFSTFQGLGLPLADSIIKNLRTNSGFRLPLLGRTDLNNAQDYRLNPYAMAGGGFFTAGIDAPMTLASERRMTGRWQLEWQTDERNTVTLGLDADGSNLSYYQTQSPINPVSLDAWTAAPRRTGAFLDDVWRVGRSTLTGGWRLDQFNAGAEYSRVPGFVFNAPQWSPFAATSDSAYAGSVARVFRPSRDQTFWTPRAMFTTPLGEHGSLRAEAGETVELPTGLALYENANADFSSTYIGTPFGRDVPYAKSDLLEIGVGEAIGGRLVLEVSAYDREHMPVYVNLLENVDDPTNPGRTLSVNVLTAAGFTHARGADLRVTAGVSPAISASATYSLNAGLYTDQAVGATATVRAPGGWTGAGWKAALRGASAVIQFRMISGIPYTPLLNTGAGEVAPIGNFAPGAQPIGAFGSERLPWTKVLDLRLTKGLLLGGMQWTAFADFRNLLNTQNLYGLYAETNSTSNSLFEASVTSGEYATLANEAQNNGALMPNGAISTANCGGWSGESGPVDCVMLRRADARFGNGDGVYTRAEQTATLNAYFNLVYGSWRFFGPQRTVRVGLELGL